MAVQSTGKKTVTYYPSSISGPATIDVWIDYEISSSNPGPVVSIAWVLRASTSVGGSFTGVQCSIEGSVDSVSVFHGSNDHPNLFTDGNALVSVTIVAGAATSTTHYYAKSQIVWDETTASKTDQKVNFWIESTLTTGNGTGSPTLLTSPKGEFYAEVHRGNS